MTPKRRQIAIALALAGIGAFATQPGASAGGNDGFDPLFDGGPICSARTGGPPAVLRNFILAKTETAPFQPVPAEPALGEKPVLYDNLGKLTFKAGTNNVKAQAWFDQGVRLAFGFNHAEAQRAFREAQKLDPRCALCFWGEALILGPNINVPMMPDANAPALAALAKASELAAAAPPRDRALIEALAKRYAADPKAVRADLDAAYARAMEAVAKQYPADDTVQVLYAEALMDTQPWDYWEAAGTKPKGNGAAIVATLETVLQRNPDHPGAIHLYIHAMEASTHADKALPYANRLGRLEPGAGHIVHMPAHIYYRLGMYREALATNQRAIAVDERYFKTSPSDPLYKSAYYPHNIHFLMVSAQIGGDGKTAIDAAGKLDAAIPIEVVKQFAIMQPVKAAPYTTHAQFSDPDTILRLKAPPADLVLVDTMYHYARALAFASRKDATSAQVEIDALTRIEREADFKPFDEWNIPAKEIVQTARLVALGRLADAKGDLASAAKDYEDAVFIEDSLSYTEPPYWYYPVRQSLAAALMQAGRLGEAEEQFRRALARAPNNGWTYYGLLELATARGDAAGAQRVEAELAKTWVGDRQQLQISKL